MRARPISIFAATAHPAENERSGQQHHCRKDSGERERQQKCVKDEFVGALALVRSERARDGRRHAAPMPLLVVCRTSMIQGNASEAPASASVPILPKEEAIKDDDANKREQVENVRRREPQQRREESVLQAAISCGAAAAGLGALDETDSEAGVMVWAVMSAPST